LSRASSDKKVRLWRSLLGGLFSTFRQFFSALRVSHLTAIPAEIQQNLESPRFVVGSP
jgi:hypothetical protein